MITSRERLRNLEDEVSEAIIDREFNGDFSKCDLDTVLGYIKELIEIKLEG